MISPDRVCMVLEAWAAEIEPMPGTDLIKERMDQGVPLYKIEEELDLLENQGKLGLTGDLTR